MRLERPLPRGIATLEARPHPPARRGLGGWAQDPLTRARKADAVKTRAGGCTDSASKRMSCVSSSVHRRPHVPADDSGTPLREDLDFSPPAGSRPRRERRTPAATLASCSWLLPEAGSAIRPCSPERAAHARAARCAPRRRGRRSAAPSRPAREAGSVVRVRTPRAERRRSGGAATGGGGASGGQRGQRPRRRGLSCARLRT